MHSLTLLLNTVYTDTCYELINNLCGCCNYWEGLFSRGTAHAVLTTVDPWHEFKEAHVDYYRYISHIDEDNYD